MRRLLIAGMAVGLGVAVFDLVSPAQPPLPENAAARVGTHLVTRAELQATVRGLEKERRRALKPEEVRRTLSRLVDERLLLEHARDADLAMNSPRIRKLVVDEILAGLRAEADSLQPDAGVLEDFFAANIHYFGRDTADAEALSSMRDLVLREWRRREAERLLAELLDRQRMITPVTVRAQLQAGPTE